MGIISILVCHRPLLFLFYCRRLPILRKDRNLLGLSLIVSKYLDAPAPGRLLTVIDFTQIEYLSLDNPITRDTPVLNNTPVAVFLTVFEMLFAGQEHAQSVRRNELELNGQGRHYSRFWNSAVCEIRDLLSWRVQYPL